MINKKKTIVLKKNYLSSKPFNHIIIDNFWKAKVAHKLSQEINSFKLKNVNAKYSNAIEKKFACNHFDHFDKNLYEAFSYLCSKEFVELISKITGIKKIYPDIGLHGGGLHIHPNKGKLNIHKDYSIHPKLNLERRLNLIVYMTKGWKPKWGGELQLWSHDKKKNKPLRLEKSITNKFNRAVLFDTTQNSWHGLPDELKMPKGIMRQSLAIYYLSDPRKKTDKRKKALFSPTKEQEGNKNVLKLIRLRSSEKKAKLFYSSK